MSRLELTPNENNFGSQFNRHFTGSELAALFEEMRTEWWMALHRTRFLVGSILRNEVPPRTLGAEIPDRVDRLVIAFLHRDDELRVMSTPRERRIGKTHLIHPKDYERAQNAGISYWLGVTQQDEELTAQLKEMEAMVREGRGSNLLFEKKKMKGLLIDPVHVMAYQAAVLSVPDLCTVAIDWHSEDPDEVKVVFMAPNTPHMREICTPAALEEECSVDREDLRYRDD